jgi:hypothetical protein
VQIREESRPRKALPTTQYAERWLSWDGGWRGVERFTGGVAGWTHSSGTTCRGYTTLSSLVDGVIATLSRTKGRFVSKGEV